MAHEDRLHKTILSDLAHICGYVDASFRALASIVLAVSIAGPRSTRSGCKNMNNNNNKKDSTELTKTIKMPTFVGN